MSHGGGDGEDNIEANAWPGFVDILSSVMIMFVFFLMITATALYFHTIQFKSKVLSNNAKVVAEQVDEKAKDLIIENKILKEQIRQMTEEKEKSEQPKPETSRQTDNKEKTLQQTAEFVASEKQTTQTLDKGDTMVVFFGEDAISLTKETNAAIIEFIKKQGAIKEITVISNMESGNQIELTARKVAVARMLNVRSGVLQSKFPSDKIKANIVKSDAIEDKIDWVKIVVTK